MCLSAEHESKAPSVITDKWPMLIVGIITVVIMKNSWHPNEALLLKREKARCFLNISRFNLLCMGKVLD